MRIEYHRTLIADTVRNDIIYQALRNHIVPGETVVADIGAGTGLLGMMAARLGAKEVFLYETAEVSAVTEAVIFDNGFENCHLMPCHSMEMHEPPTVDLIVSETLGNYAFEEDIIATLNDARERFLRPGGMILPSGVRQLMAPVTGARLDTELRVWASTGAAFGLDLSRAERMSLNNAYVRSLAVEELGGMAPEVWDDAAFDGDVAPSRAGAGRWRVERAAKIYGLAVWWEAVFGPQLVLSTGPDAPATHWEQLYFPLMEPIEVAPGHVFTGEVQSHSDPETGTHLAWAAEVRTAEGERLVRQEMDLDKGYLP